MTYGTWTGRADSRSVTKERDVKAAATSSASNYEYLRTQAQLWVKGADATGRELMQKGLNILSGLAPAYFTPPAKLAASKPEVGNVQTAGLVSVRPSADGIPKPIKPGGYTA